MSEIWKEYVKNIKHLYEIGQIETLAQALQTIHFKDLNFINYTKKYNNGMTLLEYCYQHKYFKALNFAYITQLRDLYTTTDYI